MKYSLTFSFLFTFFLNECLSQNLTPFKVDKLWGFKNSEGRIKIEAQYQYASKFIFGSSIVIKNDSVAAIDTNNNIVIPYKYHFLRQIDSSEFLFGYRAVYYGQYYLGVITKEQKIKILPEYRNISKNKGCYEVIKSEDSILSKSKSGEVFTTKSYYGLFDKNGKVIIPCKFEYLTWLNDSLIVLTTGEKGINQALYNKKGEQLTDFVYMVIDKFYEGVAKARIENKFGFIFPNGKLAIPIKFEYCEIFKNGYALILEKEKWGAINKKGKIIIKTKFTHEEVEKILRDKYGS